MDWLHKIQKKSEKERRVILWITTSLLTFVVILAWWFTPPLAPVEPAPVAASYESIISPLSQMKKVSSQMIENMSNQYSAFRKNIGF